jgi:acyl-CoA thioester hydrolase
MGIVYHVHFLDHFEAGRTELLRENGVNYKELEDSGILIQVVEVNVRYRKPAYYDDVLEIKTIVEKPPEVTIDLVNEIRRNGEDEVLVSGKVRLCFVDKHRDRLIRPPASVVETLFS